MGYYPDGTPIQLTDNQIAGFAKQAGFEGQSLIKAIAIALAESSGIANNYKDDEVESSYGLWQINLDVHKYEITQMVDPAQNAAAAWSISSNGSNFNPWSTYKNGAYLSYIDRAEKAANNPSTTLEVWQQTLVTFVKKMDELFKMQGTSTDPGWPMKWREFQQLLASTAGKAVVDLQTQQAPKSIVVSVQKFHELILHSATDPDKAAELWDMYRKIIDADFDIDIPNPVDFIPDPIKDGIQTVIDFVSTGALTVGVAVIGIGLIGLGVWGLISSTAPSELASGLGPEEIMRPYRAFRHPGQTKVSYWRKSHNTPRLFGNP